MEKNVQQTVQDVVARFKADPEALVEILRDISEELGYVSREVVLQLAGMLHLPASHIMSVASFYSMINTQPMGKHVVKLCQDAPCHVAGGQRIWDTLEQELGIPFGATTPDGQWTLMTTSCIGACSVGPVMLIDDEIYGNLTPERVREILSLYTGKQASGGEA